jgi:hypothetical protein
MMLGAPTAQRRNHLLETSILCQIQLQTESSSMGGGGKKERCEALEETAWLCAPLITKAVVK